MVYTVFWSHIKKEHEKVELRVTRAAYRSVKDDSGSKFFGQLNDAAVGKLDQSRKFYRGIRKNKTFFYYECENMWFFKYKKLKDKPLVSVTADKISLDIWNSLSDYAWRRGSDLFCDWQFTMWDLKNCNICTIYSRAAKQNDSQCFYPSVNKNWQTLLKLSVMTSYFCVLAHRLEYALNNVHKVQSLINFKLWGNVMKVMNWGQQLWKIDCISR